VAHGDGDGPQGERAALSAREQSAPGHELDRCCDTATAWPPGPDDAVAWEATEPWLWPSVESPVRGVADGLPAGLGFRRQQLHALGNAVVPVQAAYAFAVLVCAFGRAR